MQNHDLLPNTSVLEKTDIWFVCKDGDRTIRLQGSMFSGKEIIYLDDTIVHEGRSYRKKADYTFTSDIDTYEVKMRVLSQIKGNMKCSFYKNGLLLKTISISFPNPITLRKSSITWKNSLIVLLWFAFVMEVYYLQLLSWKLLLLLSIPIIFTFCFNIEKSKYIFKETDEA